MQDRSVFIAVGSGSDNLDGVDPAANDDLDVAGQNGKQVRVVRDLLVERVRHCVAFDANNLVVIVANDTASALVLCVELALASEYVDTESVAHRDETVALRLARLVDSLVVGLVRSTARAARCAGNQRVVRPVDTGERKVSHLAVLELAVRDVQRDRLVGAARTGRRRARARRRRAVVRRLRVLADAAPPLVVR